MATNEQLADIVAAVPDIGDKPAREMTIARLAYAAAGRNLHFEGQHGAEEPADTAQRLALVGELEALRAELRWYAEGAKAMACNVLAADKKAVLDTMQRFALDGGKRAENVLGPNVELTGRPS